MPKNRSLLRMMNRWSPNCTNVTFSDERRSKNWTSVLDNASTARTEATVNNPGSAFNCHPFSAEFFRCTKWKLEPSEYQVDGDDKSMFSIPHNITYDLGNYYFEDEGPGYVCVPQSVLPEGILIDLDVLALTSWVLSITFLVVTMVVFVWLPSRQNDIKPLLCHMFSLIIVYADFVVFQFLPHPSTTTCYILCFVGYFGFRASFCWLNVIVFDMWRQLRPQKFLQALVSSRRKFLLQSIYGWGMPAFILAVTYGAAVFPVFPVNSNRSQHCLTIIYDREEQTIASFATLGLLVFFNVIFCFIIAINLCRIVGDVSLVNEKYRLQLCRMCIKLMVISSVTWIWTVIEWAIFPIIMEKNFYRSIAEIVTGLQGFFLCLVLTCNNSYRKRVKDQFSSSLKKP